MRQLTRYSCLGLAVLLSGCGNGGARSGGASLQGTGTRTLEGNHTHQPRVGIDAAYHPSGHSGLLGGATSAGSTVSYRPTGPVVADDGFRPQVNGFAFENYGNDAGPINLTPANVEDIFGAQVCASGEGASCTLIPQARLWMERVNASMANGHCMGFSVTALRFFTRELSPGGYGASKTIALPIQGNTALQSLIAEDFAYQDLPSVTSRAVVGTPDQVLDELIRALRSGREVYTLGIVKADGSGGHAITPFAVEDRGHRRAEILVYDNNFPGVVRKVDVDTGRDTWRYVGGVNPSDTGEIYAGDARTESMELLPTSPGEGQQPCPFCNARGALPGAPSVIDKLHYIEVAVTGRAAQQPQLLFFDPEGRRTGFINGRLINQIPGVQVIQDYSVRNWNASAAPVFHLPLKHPTLRVLIDGHDLKHSVVTQVQANGAGLVFYVQNIHIAPGEQDAMVLPAHDVGISFVSGGRYPASPSVAVQFPQLVPESTGQARLITIATGSVGFKPGSPVTLAVHPATGTAEVSLAGARQLIPGTRVALSTDSSPAGRGGPKEHGYSTFRLPLNGVSRQVASFQYLVPKGRTLPVQIFSRSGVHVGTVHVPSTK